MFFVSLNDHDFDKSNLVTLRDRNGSYDEYKCTHCGLIGKRYGIGSDVVVCSTENECTRPKPKLLQVYCISGYVIQNFGLIADNIYDVVACPQEYEDKYKEDVWVYSKARRQPVRLLPGEYKDANSIETP